MFLFTIQPEHVGHSYVRVECPQCNHTRRVELHSVIGPVQRRDVGKRVYAVPGDDGRDVIQVENDAQRELRRAQTSVSADMKPAPDILYVVYENGCFLGAFETRQHANDDIEARTAHSERHGKGWQHELVTYQVKRRSRSEF